MEGPAGEEEEGEEEADGGDEERRRRSEPRPSLWSAAAKSRRDSTQGGRLPSEVSMPPPRTMMAS